MRQGRCFSVETLNAPKRFEEISGVAAEAQVRKMRSAPVQLFSASAKVCERLTHTVVSATSR